MTLSQKIDSDLVSATKSKDTKTVSVLRLLKSALKNAEIAKGGELSEQDALAVLEKQAKQRRDSIEQYSIAGRIDLVNEESSELAVVETYLPVKMSEEAVESLIDVVIKESGATSISDMGKVIKEVMTRASGTADGATVSRIVKERLS